MAEEETPSPPMRRKQRPTTHTDPRDEHIWSNKDMEVVARSTLTFHPELLLFEGGENAMRSAWSTTEGEIPVSRIYRGKGLAGVKPFLDISKGINRRRHSISDITGEWTRKIDGFQYSPNNAWRREDIQLRTQLFDHLNSKVMKENPIKWMDMYNKVVFLEEIGVALTSLNGINPVAAVEMMTGVYDPTVDPRQLGGKDMTRLNASQVQKRIVDMKNAMIDVRLYGTWNDVIRKYQPDDTPLNTMISAYMESNEADRMRYIDFLVRVHEIEDPDHHVKMVAGKNPAYTVLSTVPITQGLFLGEYTGVWKYQGTRVRRKLSDYAYACRAHFGPHSFREDFEKWILDAKEQGNQFRFVNDVGGYKDADEHHNPARPNVSFLQYWYDGEPHVGIIALEDILAQTELVIDYGFDYWMDNYLAQREEHKNTLMKLETAELRNAQLESMSACPPSGELDHRISELTDQLFNAEDYAKRYEAINTKLKQRLEEHRSTLKRAEENNETLTEDMLLCKKKLKDAEQKAATCMNIAKTIENKLRKSEAQREEDVSRYTAELEKRRTQYDEAMTRAEKTRLKDNQIERLGAINSVLSKDIDRRDDTINQLKKNLAEYTPAIKQLSETIASRDAEIDEMRTKVSEMTTLQNDLEETKRLLETKQMELELEKTTANVSKSTYESQIDQLNKHITFSGERIQRLENENNVMRRELATPAVEHSVYQRAIDEQNVTIRQLQADTQRLQSELAQANQNTLQARSVAHNEFARNVADQLQWMRSQLLGINVSMIDDDERLGRLMNNISSLQSRIDTVQQNLPGFINGTWRPTVTMTIDSGSDDVLRDVKTPSNKTQCTLCGRSTTTMCDCGCGDPYCSVECLKKEMPHMTQ